MLGDLLQRTLVKQSLDKRKDAENEVDDDEDEDDESKWKLNEAELRKEVAISSHNQALHQYAMLESSLKPSSSSSMPSHPSSSVPAHGLLSITLSELREGHVHAGRVVFGTLCVDAFSIRGIMSVLLGVNAGRPSKHAHAHRHVRCIYKLSRAHIDQCKPIHIILNFMCTKLKYIQQHWHMHALKLLQKTLTKCFLAWIEDKDSSKALLYLGE